MSRHDSVPAANFDLIYSPEGNYAVQPAPAGYEVLHVVSGVRVAWCERLDAACAFAESRELREAEGL